MTVKLIIESTRTPGLQYEVESYNPETQTAVLIGRYAPFEIKNFSKKTLEAAGYRLVKQEAK